MSNELPAADPDAVLEQPTGNCLHCWIGVAINNYFKRFGPQQVEVVSEALARSVGEFMAGLPDDVRNPTGTAFSIVIAVTEAATRARRQAAQAPEAERDRADDGIGKPVGTC